MNEEQLVASRAVAQANFARQVDLPQGERTAEVGERDAGREYLDVGLIVSSPQAAAGSRRRSATHYPERPDRHDHREHCRGQKDRFR
jgi:hypothetical protein